MISLNYLTVLQLYRQNQQGDKTSSGLGLSIAKYYVEAMGASIWCDKESNLGAKFIIEL